MPTVQKAVIFVDVDDLTEPAAYGSFDAIPPLGPL